jgi:hypothetical protein
MLGWMYEEGNGVARDPARAAALYKQGCDGGEAGDCTMLGLKYAEGKGVAHDPARAVALYKQGCDGGDSVGCTMLGIMYAQGKGVARDPAPRWWPAGPGAAFAGAAYTILERPPAAGEVKTTSTFDYPHHAAAGSVLAAHMPVSAEQLGRALRELDVQGVLVAQMIGNRPSMIGIQPRAQDQNRHLSPHRRSTLTVNITRIMRRVRS